MFAAAAAIVGAACAHQPPVAKRPGAAIRDAEQRRVTNWDDRCNRLLAQQEAKRVPHALMQSGLLSRRVAEGEASRRPTTVARLFSVVRGDGKGWWPPGEKDDEGATSKRWREGIAVGLLTPTGTHQNSAGFENRTLDAGVSYCIHVRLAKGTDVEKSTVSDWEVLALRFDAVSRTWSSAARLPMLYRVRDTKNTEYEDPVPVRLDFATAEDILDNTSPEERAQGRLRQIVDVFGIGRQPRGGGDVALLSSGHDGAAHQMTGATPVMMSIWFRCAQGCCSGGLDAMD